jgi:hypothetical protein
MSTGLLDFTYDSQLVDQHDHCVFVVVEDIGAECGVCKRYTERYLPLTCTKPRQRGDLQTRQCSGVAGPYGDGALGNLADVP